MLPKKDRLKKQFHRVFFAVSENKDKQAVKIPVYSDYTIQHNDTATCTDVHDHS